MEFIGEWFGVPELMLAVILTVAYLWVFGRIFFGKYA